MLTKLNEFFLFFLFLLKQDWSVTCIECWWIDPLVSFHHVFFAVDNPSQLTEILLRLAIDSVIQGRYLAQDIVVGPAWHGGESGSWVDGNNTVLLLTIWPAYPQRLPIHLDIVQLDTIHVLEDDWVPGHFSLELRFVVIAKGEVWIYLGSGRCQIEGKKVVLHELLFNYIVEHRGHTWLSQSRISKANDCFEASVENTLLILDVAEFLVLNFDCIFTWSDSNLVSVEMTGKLSGPKWNLGGLIRTLDGQRLSVIITCRTLIHCFIKDPCVARSRIEQTTNLLRRCSDKYVGHVSSIMVIEHHKAIRMIVLFSAWICFLRFGRYQIIIILFLILVPNLQKIPITFIRIILLTTTLSPLRQHQSSVIVHLR